MLSKWTGAIEIDGQKFNSYSELERSNFNFKTLSKDSTIKLLSDKNSMLDFDETKREQYGNETRYM
jgi:hypothetical protein